MFFHPLKPEPNPNWMWIAPSGDLSGIQATPRIPDHLPTPVSAKLGYYCPDYRTDFEMGDNPYRYYRF